MYDELEARQKTMRLEEEGEEEIASEAGKADVVPVVRKKGKAKATEEEEQESGEDKMDVDEQDPVRPTRAAKNQAKAKPKAKGPAKRWTMPTDITRFVNKLSTNLKVANTSLDYDEEAYDVKDPRTYPDATNHRVSLY